MQVLSADREFTEAEGLLHRLLEQKPTDAGVIRQIAKVLGLQNKHQQVRCSCLTTLLMLLKNKINKTGYETSLQSIVILLIHL